MSETNEGKSCQSNEQARMLIERVGKEKSLVGKLYKLKSTSGICGKFYTTNRISNLKEICGEILNERKK